jgi:hypothetical protein
VEKHCRAGQATDAVWHTHIACWLTMVTHTHTQYVILAFPLQQWLQECASILHLYVHCLSCL